MRLLLAAEHDVDQCGDIAHVDVAVGVDVAHGIVIAGQTQHFVDERGNVAHVDSAVGIYIALKCVVAPVAFIFHGHVVDIAVAR